MAIVRQNGAAGRPRSILSELNRRNWNIGLKLSYLSLQVVDLGLTLLAMNLGYQELNPFVRGLQDAPFQLFLIKMFIPALIAWLLPGKFLIPGIMLLVMIIGWNVKELISLALCM
jgi:hypothetical protein